jgi:hypothetical protein
MRHILPNIIYLNFQPMMIIRDLSPRRCLRASEEEREKSNALHQAMTGVAPHASPTLTLDLEMCASSRVY